MKEQTKLQIEQVVKVLENKVNAASERVEKANKCYQNSLAKIEKQKASSEKARLE